MRQHDQILNPLRVTLAKAIVTEVKLILVLWLGVVGMAQTIDTVAGNGSPGFSGDGGLATSPQLFSPVAVTFDDAGNLFIADHDNQRIRKIDTSGIITTVAGTGIRGFDGDGGLATRAKLNNPSGLATDSAGNLFISDSDNHRIRKVDTSGIITTVAGNGSYGFSGDGNAATTAQLAYPAGITVDNAGSLFIADAVNDRIRKVDTAGIITTVAGSNMAGFSGDNGLATAARLNDPVDVAVDSVGSLFIADRYNNRIRKVDTAGIITTIAGDGSFDFGGDGDLAINAKLYLPQSITVDNVGNVFIADTINQRVRKVDISGIITTVAGNGAYGFRGDGWAAIHAELRHPQSVALDDIGNLFIADYLNHRVRKVDSSGIITTVAGNGAGGFSGDGNPAAGAQLIPMAVAVDRAGNLFIAGNKNRVRKVDPSGIITTVAGSGPTGFTNDSFRGDGGPATSARLLNIQGVAVDNAGNLFIADTSNDRVRKVDSNGIITTFAGGGSAGLGDGGLATDAQLQGPTDVEIDSRGNVFIADNENVLIRKVDTNGIITTVAGGGSAGVGDGGLATDAQLNGPFGITIDRLGNLFIADYSDDRIRKVDTSGIITTVAGTGVPGFSGDGGPATDAQLDDPRGIAVDSAGNLFIADTANSRIRKVDASGIITTVVGTGEYGFRGDGRAATSAHIAGPFDVAIDRSGNLLIADSGNRRIRMVEGIATVTAPDNGPVWTVTNTNDSGTGSVREALANAQSGDTIDFASGLTGGTITLESNLPDITIANLTIDASGLDNKVTIDGDNKYRIFNHTGTGTLALNNLMVTKGFTTGDGGGIRSAGNVTITNSEISSNSTGNHGGGIRSAGDVTVINSTISNNTATSEFGAGGGIYTTGASTVRVTDSVITGNQGRFDGGGIYNDNSDTRTTNVIITKSVVSGNEVESSGGGIWSVGKIVFSGCTKIEGNKANSSNDQWRSDGASDDNGTLAATSDEPYIGDCPTDSDTDGGSVINPDPDIQIRNGNSMAAASITSGTVIDVGTFKRGEAATVDFLIRNPSAQVLALGELVLPDFLANAGEPLPETLASFGSTLLTLEVNTLIAGQLEGAFSLASNDPDAVENPFVFTIKGSVSETPANVLNILPGVELGDISAAAGEDDVVLLSFKLLVPAGSTSVTVDSLTLAANNVGIERAENLELYIDGGMRGELDNRDVLLSSTDDTKTLTFTFDARTFEPTVPMWFIVVGNF